MRRDRAAQREQLGRIALYGAMLAFGTVLLQWIDYRHMVLAEPERIDLFLLALAFLGLGIFVGRRVASPEPHPFDGNPRAQAALGISRRELDVLHELAAGRSNKEIARRLKLSPNTVKTHVARLFEKLEANRRTEAIRRARDLGLLN